MEIEIFCADCETPHLPNQHIRPDAPVVEVCVKCGQSRDGYAFRVCRADPAVYCMFSLVPNVEEEGDPWCEPCGSWHPVVRDAAHKEALQCAAPTLPPAPEQKHVLITPETCDRDKTGDSPCNVCDGGLAICYVCGKAEAELSEPCTPTTRSAAPAPAQPASEPEEWIEVDDCPNPPTGCRCVPPCAICGFNKHTQTHTLEHPFVAIAPSASEPPEKSKLHTLLTSIEGLQCDSNFAPHWQMGFQQAKNEIEQKIRVMIADEIAKGATHEL